MNMKTARPEACPTRGAARRVEAARRRAVDARHRADRRPTPENLNRAAELEAGLTRMENEARA